VSAPFHRDAAGDALLRAVDFLLDSASPRSYPVSRGTTIDRNGRRVGSRHVEVTMLRADGWFVQQ
jgi:hypothetical protein